MSALKVTCAHCAAINEVEREALFFGAKCQQCEQGLVSYRPVSVNEQNFDQYVYQTDLPVLVDFWATWCAPCVQLSTLFEQAATGWEPRVRFVKVDADATPLLSKKLNIRSIPTLILFYKGEEIERRTGNMPAQMFDQWLEQKVNVLGA